MLGATGTIAKPVVDPNIFHVTTANLADDVDVTVVFTEFYGVPWESMLADGGPPTAWVHDIHQIAQEARALGKPVFVSLALGRNGLINDARALGDGGYEVKADWAPCFDFDSDAGAAFEASYLQYLRFMISEFEPRWLNVGTEISSYGRNCPSAWPGVARVMNHAVDEVHRAAPGTVAFPSFVLEELYGRASCPKSHTAAQCSAEAVAQIDQLQRDRFALSVYPSVPLADDAFTRFARRVDGGLEPIIVAETGANSVDVRVGDGTPASCTTVLTATPATQRDFLDTVLRLADANQLELVNWWSDRDLLPDEVMGSCPCAASAQWCDIESAFSGNTLLGDFVFKVFGAMGLRHADGSPKEPIMSRWRAYRAR